MLQHQLRRMSVRTSARNQFVGPVIRLEDGASGMEVVIRIDGHQELVSRITRESARLMELQPGVEVHAFFKAASVTLQGPARQATSREHCAQNRLTGTVAQAQVTGAHLEVAVDLEGGRSLVAICPAQEFSASGLAVGKACRAAVDPGSVMLFRFD
jgi:molybdate transport system regulatory protein